MNSPALFFFVFLMGAVWAGCQQVSADEGTASQAQEPPAGNGVGDSVEKRTEYLMDWIRTEATEHDLNPLDELVLAFVIIYAIKNGNDGDAVTLDGLAEIASREQASKSLQALTAAGLLIDVTAYRPGELLHKAPDVARMVLEMNPRAAITLEYIQNRIRISQVLLNNRDPVITQDQLDSADTKEESLNYLTGLGLLEKETAYRPGPDLPAELFRKLKKR